MAYVKKEILMEPAPKIVPQAALLVQP